MLETIDVSAAVFARGLDNLKALAKKGEAHANGSGTDPKRLLDAQLADDMYTFAVQAHWACEGAKLAIARLLGAASTPLAHEAKSFGELFERIDATIAWLSTVDPEALEAGLARTIEMRHGAGTLTYRGDRFITEYAIPNFFFHVAIAYGILRAQGVPLRKADFLGA